MKHGKCTCAWCQVLAGGQQALPLLAIAACQIADGRRWARSVNVHYLTEHGTGSVVFAAVDGAVWERFVAPGLRQAQIEEKARRDAKVGEDPRA